jgi:hypothetical protein
MDPSWAASSGQAVLNTGAVCTHDQENARPAADPVAPMMSPSVLEDASRVIDPPRVTDCDEPPTRCAVTAAGCTKICTEAEFARLDTVLLAVKTTS